MPPRDTAKVFMTGRSQAVRLPAAYRFNVDEVYVRRDEVTGDVILSTRPDSWDGLFAALEKAQCPADFLSPQERAQGSQDRDPLDGIAD